MECSILEEAIDFSLVPDMSRSCDVDSPSDAVECWISNHKESRVATPDHPPTTQSPERGSQVSYSTWVKCKKQFFFYFSLHISNDHLSKIAAKTSLSGMNTCVLCAVCLPQTTEEVVLMPNVDMKEEEMQTLSCSSLHLRGWSSTLDGEFLTDFCSD